MNGRSIAKLMSGVAMMFSLFATTYAQTQPTFTRQQYSAPPVSLIVAQADFNNDGRLDVVVTFNDGVNPPGLAVFLAGSGGSFTVSKRINASIPTAVVEDFNRDGKADLLYSDNNGGMRFAAGHGDGTFSSSVLSGIGFATAAATADFNGDGKLDVVWANSGTVQLALGNGNGTFQASRVIYTGPSTSSLVVGDFDGDGRADVATGQDCCYNNQTGATATVAVLYGNGAGSFTTKTTTVPGLFDIVSADLNQDGKSDIVGVYTEARLSQYPEGVHILYGSASRTLTLSSIPTTDFGISPSAFPVAVADFNGDNRLDFAFGANTANGPFAVLVYVQNSSGTFTRSNDVFLGNDFIRGVFAGDYNRDHKPDIAVIEQNGVLDDLVNTTASGAFPSCFAPGNPGINICSPPAGTTIASPVNFNIAASAYSPLRKSEVWIDGTKRFESFLGYGDYSFLRSAISLRDGSHTATIFAATYDNRLFKKSFAFSVAGGSCATPTNSTGTVICSPASGSTVSSPVNVQAKGGSSVKNMEAWVDGVRKYAGSGNTVSLSLSVAAGSHKLTIFSKNGSTVLSSAVSNFTVK